MRLRSLEKRIIGCALILTLIMLSSSLFLQTMTLADGSGSSIAMTGTFAGQKYEIPTESSASSSEVYVTIQNTGSTSYNISMTTIAPVGVKINLSNDNFVLAPDQQKKINITVIVTKDAAAGNHTLSIKATPYITNPGGVQLLPEIVQSATLNVIGESAHVSVMAVSPEGKQVPAVVRLFKLINDRLSEICYNESGYLEAIVAPGDFTAEAYVGGRRLGNESFSLAANENKSITLQAGTIFFQSPGVIAYSDKTSGKLAYAHIYYTLMNVYQEVNQVNVRLLVKFNGNQIDERDIYPNQSLGTDRPVAGVYDYTPTSGWSNGIYVFTLKLFVNNVSYGNSPEMPFEVKDGGATGTVPGNTSGGTGESSNNLPLIIGIVCAAAILVGIAYYMIHKSRKSKNTKNKK